MKNSERLELPAFEECLIHNSAPRPSGIYAPAYAKLLELAKRSDAEQEANPQAPRRGIIIDLKSSSNGHRVCRTMAAWAEADGYQLIFDKPIAGTGRRELHMVPLQPESEEANDD